MFNKCKLLYLQFFSFFGKLVHSYNLLICFVYRMFGKFTMEVILASAFGRWKDIQTATEDDDLTVAASSVFGFSKEGSRLNGMVLRRLLCKCATIY